MRGVAIQMVSHYSYRIATMTRSLWLLKGVIKIYPGILQIRIIKDIMNSEIEWNCYVREICFKLAIGWFYMTYKPSAFAKCDHRQLQLSWENEPDNNKETNGLPTSRPLPNIVCLIITQCVCFVIWFILNNKAATGNVWIIQSFRYVLHVEAISCVITNCGQNQWVIPFPLSIAL